MFKRIVYLLCCVGFLGCEADPAAVPKWRVELIRPDGTVQKTFTVSSKLSPKGYPEWGGQVTLYRDNGPGAIDRYVSTGRMAPTGWMWESEKIVD